MQEMTQPAFLSDGEIIDLFWNRSDSAIPETERKYGKYLFSVAENLLSDPKECEACKDETYLRVWNAIPPERPAVFSSYLSRLVRHAALDRFRGREGKEKAQSSLNLSLVELSETISDGNTVSHSFESRELGRAINDFVAGLPTLRRVLFVSRYFYGKTVEEIAATYSIPPPSVYRILSQIRGKLKIYLTEKEFLP